MPIEIEASLSQRAVFFAGETINCEIKFTYKNNKSNNDLKANSTDNSPRPSLDNLNRRNCVANQIDERTIAWASAQIYCQCHINESRVVPLNGIIKRPNISAPEMETSFVPTRGETGHCLLSTKPTILFCNQKIQRGQTKKFIYTEKIPENAPPSYKGQSVRFSYKITIGIGSINGPTKLIRLPIRVLGTEDIWLNSKRSLDPGEDENPFLEERNLEDHSLIDVYLNHLTYSTSQRNHNIYNISCSQGSAGKFSLSKTCYRIGEDVQGYFDFSESTVRCIKYKVSLQSEETISDEFQRPGIKHKSPCISYSKHEECCYNCRHTNFSLPIPITATPEFSCNILSLRWRIHCEFTTSSSSSETRQASSETSLDTEHKSAENQSKSIENDLETIVPNNINIETMTWDVPVRIISSNPLQVSLMSSFPLGVLDALN